MQYNLIIPIAGRGQRMESQLPKPMILAGDRTILEWGMQSLDYSECEVTFVILQEHAYNHGLDAFLETKFKGCNIIQLGGLTRGSVETAYHGIVAQAWRGVGGVGFRNVLDQPLAVFAPDVYFWPPYKITQSTFTTNRILTFKANSPHYSYVRKDPVSGAVTETREKIVISQEAAVGLYCFQTGHIFAEYAQQVLSGGLPELGEFYVCPLYNLLIRDGLPVDTTEIPAIHIMGTRNELEFFERQVYPYLQGPQEWILCSDHSGWEAKERFKQHLMGSGEKVVDCGCYSLRDCDRYDFIQLAVRRVLSRPGAVALGFCQSGQGMCMDANKVPGIRAALLSRPGDGTVAIAHNNANFFGIPNGTELSVIREIQDSRFEGGRHQNRLMKVGL